MSLTGLRVGESVGAEVDVVGLNDGEKVGVRLGLKVGSAVANGEAEGLLVFSSTIKEKKLDPVSMSV